eukprot:tig00000711_g3430.t1
MSSTEEELEEALSRAKRELAPEVLRALEALEEFLPEEPCDEDEDESEEEDDADRRRGALQAELALVRLLAGSGARSGAASVPERDEELAQLKAQLAAAQGEVGGLKGSLEAAVASLEDFEALRRCIGSLEEDVRTKQEQLGTLLVELTAKTEREANVEAQAEALLTELARAREAQLAASEADRAAKARPRPRRPSPPAPPETPGAQAEEIDKLCQEVAEEAAAAAARAAAEADSLRGALATREAELNHVLAEWSRLEERVREMEAQARARDFDLRGMERCALAEAAARKEAEAAARRSREALERLTRRARGRRRASSSGTGSEGTPPSPRPRAPRPSAAAAGAGAPLRVWLRAHFGPRGCSIETRNMQPLSIQFGGHPRGSRGKQQQDAGLPSGTEGVLEVHALVQVQAAAAEGAPGPSGSGSGAGPVAQQAQEPPDVGSLSLDPPALAGPGAVAVFPSAPQSPASAGGGLAPSGPPSPRPKPWGSPSPGPVPSGPVRGLYATPSERSSASDAPPYS